MADHHQKNKQIHPLGLDVEAQGRPALPLLLGSPRGLSNSEKVEQQRSLRPPILLQSNSINPPPRPPPPPPATTTTTAAIATTTLPNNIRKRRSCCCKCICWTISLFVLLLIIIAVVAAIIYLVFRPKLPNYSVDSLNISDLRLNLDMSLYARFNVKITATNPNKKIGIYYERGSRLSVFYSNTNLCQGTLPKFYQGHRNTTVLHVALTGQNQYGSTLMAALQEQQQTGRIPLDLKVDVPVSVKLGQFKLRKVRILGTCLLIVDSLSANNLISIKASSCKFRLKL